METIQDRPALAAPPSLAPDSFARRVEEGPDLVALSVRGRSVSYRELGARAERIARALLARGVEPGEAVAVSGGKGVGLVAALLGVLRSGAAMLPLDPALPSPRRRAMARIGGARLVLSVGGEDGIDLPTLAVGADGEVDGDAPMGPARPALSGDGAAYVVFTSGTTGEPAGVEGSHAALGLFLDWQRATFHVGPGDRMPFLTGLSFDVMLRDLLLPLTSGAALCIPPDGVLASPAALRDWLATERITLLHAVPSLAATWLDAPDTSTAPMAPLRVTFFAGEPLPGPLVTRWRSAFPSTRVVNLYGPTETTLARFWHEVPAEPAHGAQPVGFPIPSTDALVVAEDGSLAAPGEPGEVLIRTPFRARRLLGGRRFVPDPTGGDDLVYPTGDRGRFRDDGSLELLGRLDAQVKINGVRVEPDEVTAHLLAHPGVRAAAVVPRDGRLVAYVVTGDGVDLPLQSFLASRLPTAMVPSRVVLVDRLPLTERGKLDRSRLPVPAPEGSEPPATDAERLASALFAEVLGVIGVPPPARHASFLELGGTSLEALAFLARLEERHGVRLEPADLFDAPTVAGVAERIEAVRGTGEVPSAVPQAMDGEVPLTPPQRRLWLDAELRGLNGPAYQLAWALEWSGPFDVERFRASLDRVAARHPALRMTFPLADGLPVPRVLPPARVDLPLLDLTALPRGEEQDAELRRRAASLAAAPLGGGAPPPAPPGDAVGFSVAAAFDLASGPPFRAALARLAPDRHVALFVAHHVVLDAWSRWLLIGELLRDYDDASEKPSTDLTYAAEARRLASARPDPAGLHHFVSRLRGAPTLALPVDGPHPESVDPRGARVRGEVPPALRRRVEAFAKERAATPYVVLLAAFQLLLSRWCGQDDVTVGSPVTGRTTPGSEGLLGCFINLVALRADLSGSPTFTALVERARDETLRALAHQATPFEAVVETLRPPRTPGRAPLVDVLFNLVDVPSAPPSLDGVEVSYPDDLFPAGSPFAMTLYVREKGNRLTLTLLHRVELFTSAAMERLLSRYVALLTEMLDVPDRPLVTGGPTERSAATSRAARISGRTPPGTEAERAVAAIWREELRVEDVAIEDGFFEIGGHSLAAARVVARLRERLGIELPLRALLESQTLGALAAAVEAAPRAAPVTAASGPIPLSLSQARLLSRIEVEGPASVAAYNIPRAVTLTGPLDVDRLASALRGVLARHGALRTRFIAGPRQVVEPDVPLDLTIEDAEDVERTDLESLLSAEATRPFDLHAAPLFRARLLRLGPEEHLLLLTAHHLVADCWSMGIPYPGSSGRWMPGLLIEELARRYEARSVERTIPGWGPGERVAAESAWLTGDEARRQRAFWERTLAGTPRLDLPARHREASSTPRRATAASRYDGVRHPVAIPSPVSDALRHLARDEGSTLFEALLAIYGAFLHLETGAGDVPIGTPVAGRTRPELASMVAFLGNHVTLRTRVDPGVPFRDLLSRTRSTCREAFGHQELPIEALGDDVPFSVRLVLHRADRPPLAAGGLVLSPRATRREIAKHDLTLLLVDAGEGPLEGWLETPADLFSTAALERLSRRLIAIAVAAAAAPARRVASLGDEA